MIKCCYLIYICDQYATKTIHSKLKLKMMKGDAANLKLELNGFIMYI